MCLRKEELALELLSSFVFFSFAQNKRGHGGIYVFLGILRVWRMHCYLFYSMLKGTQIF